MKSQLWAAIAASLLVSAAQAHVIVSYAEAPGVQDAASQSVVMTGIQTFTFDNVTPDVTQDVTWSGVGTYTNLHVISADKYGGAGGDGRYAVQGTGWSTPLTTLTFDAPRAYFGMWWSAGDNGNKLEFYNGTTVVGTFTTNNLVNRLDSVLNQPYRGNPTASYNKQNDGENYAFINFFGDTDTTWTSVKLSNAGGSGFESDNHTVSGWKSGDPMPGVPLGTYDAAGQPVPEPAILGGLLATSCGLLIRKRQKKA